jgi:hypothetical protein
MPGLDNLRSLASHHTVETVCPLLEVDNAKSGNPKPVQTSVVGHFSDMPDRITLIGG